VCVSSICRPGAAQWKINDKKCYLRVEIPGGTSALITMPGGKSAEVGPGSHQFDNPY